MSVAVTARGTGATEWLGAASRVVCGKELVQETAVENFPRYCFVADPVYADRSFISPQLKEHTGGEDRNFRRKFC